MQGACGIVLEEERAFLSFARIWARPLAGLDRFLLKVVEEQEVSLLKSEDFCASLKANAEAIEKEIAAFEKKYSLPITRIFLQLPPELYREKAALEKIVLSKKKKLRASDIDAAKKYLEDKFLEWDERCLHHIVLNYKVEGIDFSQVPLGFFTNKIELSSFFIYIKDSLYQETAEIFANLERNFEGFTARKLSMFSQGFKEAKNNQIVVAVNDFNSYVLIRKKKGEIIEKKFDFSIERIIHELAKQYTVASEAARELFRRYGTFKVIPYQKEIVVKKGDNYLNISTQALGNFLKKIFAEHFKEMLEDISVLADACEEKLVFAFIGPLIGKEGFYGYLKSLMPYSVEVPARKFKSSSFGCLRYGVLKPLENEHKRNLSFLERIKKVYREYF